MWISLRRLQKRHGLSYILFASRLFLTHPVALCAVIFGRRTRKHKEEKCDDMKGECRCVKKSAITQQQRVYCPCDRHVPLSPVESLLSCRVWLLQWSRTFALLNGNTKAGSSALLIAQQSLAWNPRCVLIWCLNLLLWHLVALFVCLFFLCHQHK